MINLNDLTIEDILKSYDFTHKFYVSYALFCAKEVNKNIGHNSKEVIDCISVIERYLKDKATKEECKIAGDIAYNADTHATYSAAAYATAHAAYTVYDAAYAAYNATHAADYSSYFAAYDTDSIIYNNIRQELINRINNLTKLEKLILGIYSFL